MPIETLLAPRFALTGLFVDLQVFVFTCSRIKRVVVYVLFNVPPRSRFVNLHKK